MTQKKRILVQADHLTREPGAVDSNAPIHELGHSLESIVQARDPQFYSQWQPRLQEAYAKAKGEPFDPAMNHLPAPGSGSVTNYALTNQSEYVAEGVANYYDDPKLLKAKDPALFQLTQELLQHANTLGTPR